MKTSRFSRTLAVTAGVLAFFSVSTRAATYYVDGTAGSNANAGTLAAPFQTINHAIGRLADRATNTITIRGGSYAEVVVVNKSGASASGKLVIRAHENEQVVIDGGNSLPAGAQDAVKFKPLFAVLGSHVEVRDLTVRNSRGRGVGVDDAAGAVSHVLLHNIDTNHCFGSGIHVKDATHVTVENCRAWRCGLSNSPANRAEWGEDRRPRPSWPVALTFADSSHCVARGCEVFENYGEGIGDLRSDDNLIENCVVYDNYKVNIYLDNSQRSVVRRNLVYATDKYDREFWRTATRPTPGILINSEPYSNKQNFSEGVAIYNNFVFNAGTGIGLWASVVPNSTQHNCTIAHNTVVNTRTGPVGTGCTGIQVSGSTSRSGNLVTNNLVSMAAGARVAGSTAGVAFSHNYWSSAVASPYQSVNDIVGGSVGLNLGAGETPDRAWLKISASSVVIGKGSAVTGMRDDFFGTTRSSPDIGAHEHVAAAPERPTSSSRRPPPRPDVLVVGDAGVGVTPEMARPSPGKPIRYLLVGGVEKDLGDPVVDVKAPDAGSVRRELAKALASQGYVEAREGGPKPAIAILYSWGTANLVTLDVDQLEGRLSAPAQMSAGSGSFASSISLEQPPLGVLQFNRREISQLIGTDKTDRHWVGSLEGDRLNEAYRNDRVYVTVAALDLAAAARKERRLLWRTRISIDWRDHKPEALAVMLASAAPFFGLNTERSVFVDESLRRKAEVEIGTTRVIEDRPESSRPVEKKKP